MISCLTRSSSWCTLQRATSQPNPTQPIPGPPLLCLQVVDFVLDEILNQSVHPVFGPLRDAGSTVVTVMEDLLTDDRPELPH